MGNQTTTVGGSTRESDLACREVRAGWWPQRRGADTRSVLVVDEDEVVALLVSSALRFGGFAATTATTARGVLAAVAERRPDLVVLDNALGDLDRTEVLRRLPGDGSHLPVILLVRRDTVDERPATRYAADDYLVKPFRIEELLAKVHAVLHSGDTGLGRPTLRVADLELDEAGREVRRAGRAVHLAPTEFELLRYLMRHEGVTLSKKQILDKVWRYGFAGKANIVELYICYLRRKIDYVEPRLIHTIRGVGYVLRAPSAVPV